MLFEYIPGFNIVQYIRMEQHSFEDVWQLKEKIKDAAKSTAADKKSDNYYS